jgi:acetolactate synthase-1/2/3 large subunit
LDLVEKVHKLINQSSKPLFLAGEGVVWSGAERELIESAETFSIPVVTNDDSRGCIPEDHPLFLGVAGKFGHRSANLAMGETDLLIALGSRMDDQTTLNWSLPKRGTKIVQVYPDKKEIGRQIPVDVGIIGSVKGFLKVLLENSNISCKTCWYADQIQKVRMTDHYHFLGSKRDSFLVNPYKIISDLGSVVESDTIFAVGSGLHTLFATKLVIHHSRSFIRSIGLGGMGYAFPAAMGAKLAFPKRHVVLLIGDGDFLITLPDLETAVRLGISFLIIIFNNGSYGALKFRQMTNYEGRYIGVDFKNPDFAQLAAIFGARGRRIDEPGSLRSAIEEGMRSDSPYIIDAVIDPYALPEDMSHFKIQ